MKHVECVQSWQRLHQGAMVNKEDVKDLWDLSNGKTRTS